MIPKLRRKREVLPANQPMVPKAANQRMRGPLKPMAIMLAIVAGAIMAIALTPALASRNASGTMSLAAGNPVTSNTTISSTWANNTLSDISSEITDSLSRSNKGAMLANLELVAGADTAASPALTWSGDTDTGIYRIGADNIGVGVGATKILDIASTGLSVTGTGTFSGVMKVPDGTKTAPGLEFTSDPDTGIYRIGANNLGVSCGDTKILDVATTGLGVTGTTSSTGVFLGPAGLIGAPAYSFTGDPDTGFWNYAANGVELVAAGADVFHCNTSACVFQNGIQLNVTSGTTTIGGQVQASTTADAAAPVYSFQTDTDTGMYRSGADELSVTAGGSQRQYWTTSGTVVAGANTFTVGTGASTFGGTMAAKGVFQAGGRITLTTAVPVTTADVTGATTVYYSPYATNYITLYDGTNWVTTTFSEVSQATTDNTKSPAAVAASKVYDIFVWSDSGTIRATRGPAWSSDTSRGTGAGTSELELFEGRYMNKVSITNGPAARRGVYVGSIGSDASSQINDSAAKRDVWNNFNRVLRHMRVLESTDSWTYNTATTRQARATATNQLEVVHGLDEDAVWAAVRCIVNNSAGAANAYANIGLDSTTTVATGAVVSGMNVVVASTAGVVGADWTGVTGIGRHTIVWLENGTGAGGTTTWFGDAGLATGLQQSGIHGTSLQ